MQGKAVKLQLLNTVGFQNDNRSRYVNFEKCV